MRTLRVVQCLAVTGTPSQLVKLSWCNYATAPGGQYVLAMQDDGNLCVYTGTPTQYVKNMWCHNTNVAPPPPAPAHLTTGQSLTAGQALQSPNKQYVARQQNDGNLCVYKGNLTSQERVLWCHHKVAPGGQYVTAMQSDGNLCTYTGTTSQYVKNTWCTNAVAPGGQYVLAMQDDGNLCVYTGTPTQYGKNLWCHNTGMATSPAGPAGPAGPRKGVTVVNNSASFSWITINQNVSGINQIIKSGCIAPRGERSWPEVLLTDIPGAVSAIRVRVERTSTTNCASQPNNAYVTCDTRTEWWNRQTVVEASVSGLKYMLYTFDDNCKIAVSKGR